MARAHEGGAGPQHPASAVPDQGACSLPPSVWANHCAESVRLPVAATIWVNPLARRLGCPGSASEARSFQYSPQAPATAPRIKGAVRILPAADTASGWLIMPAWTGALAR